MSLHKQADVLNALRCRRGECYKQINLIRDPGFLRPWHSESYNVSREWDNVDALLQWKLSTFLSDKRSSRFRVRRSGGNTSTLVLMCVNSE